MTVEVTLLEGLNAVANRMGTLLRYPITSLPGWLSITLFSAVMGIALLIIYKLTSNQRAIGAIRNDIKANLLAVKLFKGNFSLAIRSQVNIMAASLKLLTYSLVPLVIMVLPVSFILAQLGLWYQAAPASVGRNPVIVKLTLNDRLSEWPDIVLVPQSAVVDLTGPVRVISRKEVFWKIRPQEAGIHKLVFRVGDEVAEKTLSVGTGFMPVSIRRPAPELSDILLNPLESAFEEQSFVKSIEIFYPDRPSHVYGTDWWLIYLCVVSMVFALMLKPLVKVNI